MKVKVSDLVVAKWPPSPLVNSPVTLKCLLCGRPQRGRKRSDCIYCALDTSVKFGVRLMFLAY